MQLVLAVTVSCAMRANLKYLYTPQHHGLTIVVVAYAPKVCVYVTIYTNYIHTDTSHVTYMLYTNAVQVV